jgi:hypothetical protein
MQNGLYHWNENKMYAVSIAISKDSCSAIYVNIIYCSVPVPLLSP